MPEREKVITYAKERANYNFTDVLYRRYKTLKSHSIMPSSAECVGKIIQNNFVLEKIITDIKWPTFISCITTRLLFSKFVLMICSHDNPG